MKKILTGLLIVIILIGCGKKPPEPLNRNMKDKDFKKVLEYDREHLIKMKTDGFTLTEEQKRMVNERIKVLRQEKQEREAKAREVKRQRELEIEKQRKLKGDYTVNKFVDEFGDYTNTKYIITGYKNSTFSNSATRNSLLEGSILIYKEGIRFDSYEYGRRGNNTATFIGGATIKMKNSDGKIITVPASKTLAIYNWEYDKYYSKVVNFLKASKGDVRVVISGKYSTTHNITISANGFTYNYKEMRK